MPVTNTSPSYKEGLKTLVDQLGEMLPKEQFTVFNADAAQLAENHTSPLKLQKGDTAPSFSLPNAIGKNLSLRKLLDNGPVVLTFYRGTWCPYCNLQLKQYQEILPQIKELGATLVAISPQTPDSSLSMAETNALEFEVLSDIGNKVAVQFTTVFRNADAPIQAMTDLGYDFDSFYADKTAEIPVPATFVIDQEGIITFAHSGGGDYRERTEPQDILDALNA